MWHFPRVAAFIPGAIWRAMDDAAVTYEDDDIEDEPAWFYERTWPAGPDMGGA